jgi:hypothetical protein
VTRLAAQNGAVAAGDEARSELAQQVQSGLKRVMRGFEPLPKDDPGFAYTFGRRCRKFEVDHRRLPLPDIVRVVFLFLGSNNLGRAEKLAWEHTFQVDGVPCSIASQKFGLRLYIDVDAVPAQAEADALAERITGAIIAGQGVVEREVLRPLGTEQMREGNITIRNQYLSLRRAYSYFREGAKIAYAGGGRLAETRSPGGGSWFMPERHEGWWNTFAMVMAYFSLLEHVLVGCLPFAGFEPEKETVTEFIGSKWGEKFKRIFDLSADAEAMRRFSALHSISETYRNTYGHGGFDKAGATVAFHIPGIGAVPATLSDIRTSPHFDFVPTAEEDFETICRTFDDLDQWLASGALRDALKWITGGLDYRFDAQFRERLKVTATDFDAFVNAMSHQAEMAANMDW